MLHLATARLPSADGRESASELPLEAIESFFDPLPGACFFSKDASLHFTAANAATVQLCGVRDRAEVIGRSVRDFFSEPTRERYERAELRAMRTGRPGTNRLDQCVRLRGRPVWLLLNHWPILRGGKSTGVVTIARSLDSADHRQVIYERLSAALDYLHANFGAAFSYRELAVSAGVSLSQLQRDFVQVLGQTPRAYLTGVRFETALDMLEEKKPVVEVAHACGYADQSAFTRRFRSAIGASPMQYTRARQIAR